MKDTLVSKSAQWAQEAIRSYLDNEHEQFFVQAGVSFELLGKAFLASFHPSLIVDKDFDSLLQVCGAGSHSKRSPGNIKTIGAREVIARAIQIVPQLKSYKNQLVLLADLRNGFVHLGTAISATLSDVVRSFLQATHVLLESCQVSLDDHFGDFTEVARRLIDESSQEVERIVTLKIARAREGYKQKYGELEDRTVKQLADLIYRTYDYRKYHDTEEYCPVCSELGISSGDYKLDWEQSDPDSIIPELIVTIHVNHFSCKMCGLELDGREEIKAAGLNEEWDVMNPDPADFFEPDYG